MNTAVHTDLADFPRGVFRSPFKPAWWLRNAHAQTLFSVLLRPPMTLARERVTVDLADGDFLDMDLVFPATWTPGEALVLVVHGLSGSSESHYVQGLQQALLARGWASAALNCRGASGRVNHLPRGYHAGGSDDVLQALSYLAKRYPASPLALVGYSLGGNMTLKLMGEQGMAAPVFAAVAVSVPLRLDVCANRLDQGFSKVYRRHFMQELTAYWAQKQQHFHTLGQAHAAERIAARLACGPFQSFWQFDHDVVAPLHGFADVHDYYRRSSACFYLRHIERPTLLIQAEDDPFMTTAVMPQPEELSPALHVERAARGGHVGFIEGGSPKRPQYYLERRIPDFLQAVLRQQHAARV